MQIWVFKAENCRLPCTVDKQQETSLEIILDVAGLSPCICKGVQSAFTPVAMCLLCIFLACLHILCQGIVYCTVVHDALSLLLTHRSMFKSLTLQMIR